MRKEKFKRLSLQKKLQLLKNSGEFIGSRELISHRVYLFCLEKKFVELYVYKATNQAHWVEMQENRTVLEEYVEGVRLGIENEE